MGRAIWGDFEVDLDRVLGRGGMGTVYAARQLSLDREVAVKVLDLSRAESADVAEGFLQRFRIEIASTAATLYRSDSGTLRRVSTAKFPSATARGAVAVVPVAGLTLVFLNDRLEFVLSAREYPLDDGIRLGAAGTVEVESIRVVSRDR